MSTFMILAITVPVTLGVCFCISEILDYLREKDTLDRKNQK